MTPGALSCRQDRSPASRRRSQWNPGKNISKVHLQLKNTERAVACAALRTAFQNMDPEKEVFLSSEQTVLISFTEHQDSKAGSKSVRFAALALPFDAVVTSCKSAAAGVSSCVSWMSIFAFSPVLFTWLSSIYRSLPEDRQRLVDNQYGTPAPLPKDNGLTGKDDKRFATGGFFGLRTDAQITMMEMYTFKTVVHGTVVAALAWYAYTCTEIPPGGVWLDVPLVRFESAVYFGYLISDLIQTAMYPHVSNIEFVSHHVMSLYSSFIAASYPAMPYYANVCYMMQLSNPIILEELGYKGSGYYTWNGVTLIVTCFISRILVTGIATVNLAKIMIFQDAFRRQRLKIRQMMSNNNKKDRPSPSCRLGLIRTPSKRFL
ncbi:hypothetical protein Bbelb_136840 [Branchiostoma belcheri]|nr:hypothetical protein Bbelb_136840 [Branchiostoma belcheri]